MNSAPSPASLPRPWLLLALVAVVAVLPFASSLAGGFIYDDLFLVLGSEPLRAFRLGDLWLGEFFDNAKALHFRYYRPLVTTSWALDWALFGGHPAGFHLTNLALHGVAACLVFLTLRRFSGREGAALFATLLWAFHPTKTEAVAWISGRTDLLATIGLLLALLGTARRLRGRTSGLALEVIGVFIAFTSKESAVVLPGLVAVEAWVADGRPALDLRVVRRSIARALPHGAFVALYLSARAWLLPIEPKDFAHAQSARDVALFAVETWGEITKLLFFPFPLTMHRAPVYIDEAKNHLHDPLRLALGLLAVVALVTTTALFAKRRPMLVVGVLLTAFLFLPVANLRPTRMPVLAAERFAYLPTIGLALALTSLLPRGRERFAKLAWGAGGFALFAAATISALHTPNLENEERFWAHELRVHPNLPTAVRPALVRALGEGRNREALELAGRGYRGAKAWTIAHPFDVEFSLYAAQIVEAMTVDRDEAKLATLAAFYRAFFLDKAGAELETSEQHFKTHGGRLPASWLREISPGRFAGFEIIGARALARARDCAGALSLAREARSSLEDPNAKTTAALVFARCRAWEEAGAVVQDLPEGPIRDELGQNLRAAEEALAQIAGSSDLEAALTRSRVGAMLLDRRMAFTALVGHEEALFANPQAALYFARTALAAGEDEAAKEALSQWLPAEASEEQLAAWSRELGR